MKKYGDKSHLIYSVTSSIPKKGKGKDTILTIEYYLATEDINGSSSDPSKDQKLGLTTIDIIYKKSEATK